MARYETAPYETLETDGQFELRGYAAFTTAAVDTPAWEGSDGFRQIFDYISGGNDAGEKISMTTPVINELAEEASSTEFVMPSDYSGKPLPKPQNPAIHIKEHAPRLVAALRFSGSVGTTRLGQMEGKLRRWIESKGLQATSPLRLARYNPPFVPPFLRRNELLLDVRRK